MAKTPLQHAHHVVPTFTYVKTLIALTALMLLTIFASYWTLPGGVVSNNLLALLIAFIKSFLVIWVFMGIRWATKLTRLWAICGFIILPMMFIMFQDYMVRHRENIPGWSPADNSALPRILDPIKENEQVPKVQAGLRPHDPG